MPTINDIIGALWATTEQKVVIKRDAVLSDYDKGLISLEDKRFLLTELENKK